MMVIGAIMLNNLYLATKKAEKAKKAKKAEKAEKAEKIMILKQV